MKRSIKLISILAVLIVDCALHSAPIASTLTLKFSWSPSTQEMAGLGTNAYAANIAFLLLSTTDVTVPMAQWPVTGVSQALSYTNQGPVGSVWTNQINTDGSSRFYAMLTSNTISGTVSPPSNQKPWFQPPPAGIINSVLSP